MSAVGQALVWLVILAGVYGGILAAAGFAVWLADPNRVRTVEREERRARERR